MQERVITLAAPVFFALIALELLWGWLRPRITYRINDALTSIGPGVMSQATGAFTRVLRVGIYAAIFDAIALTRRARGALDSRRARGVATRRAREPGDRAGGLK